MTDKFRYIELLAPAKNLECAIAAVDHGADAVYIGASRFGARSSAGNSLEDIATLVAYAHQFRVKVYVTVNTILKDDELADTEKLVWQLYRCGVDALIVQDMGLLKLNLPPIPLHASTQMDNRTPQKVKFLRDQGFSQVVLARELTLKEISQIHEACDVPLEVFVHGALCVSYSGQCYVSQHCFGRSANRGECAQFCRLSFDLEDANGKTITKDRHLLSLKDLNQSEELERLLDAGASSLKIEGRLKDVTYVKNVTAYYRQKLDAIFSRRTEYRKASTGNVKLNFTPQLEKSFNRGFTHYFLNGRTTDIFSFNTPKSMGEYVGNVKEVRGRYLVVAGVKSFANGDGFCFLDGNGHLKGFRVNKVENNKLYPMEMPDIAPRTRLYRNYDHAFEVLLGKSSAVRKVAVSWIMKDYADGFKLTCQDEDGISVCCAFPYEKVAAQKSQTENIRLQLGKLGQTVFEVNHTDIFFTQEWFVPSSVLTDWRRQVLLRLEQARRIAYRQALRHLQTPFTQELNRRHGKQTEIFVPDKLTYTANVMNHLAEEFYRENGALEIDPAYEKQEQQEVPLMFCKHCLRYSLGWCVRNGGERSPYKEPYYLISSDGRRFRLEFDCAQCQMKVYAAR